MFVHYADSPTTFLRMQAFGQQSMPSCKFSARVTFADKTDLRLYPWRPAVLKPSSWLHLSDLDRNESTMCWLIRRFAVLSVQTRVRMNAKIATRCQDIHIAMHSR